MISGSIIPALSFKHYGVPDVVNVKMKFFDSPMDRLGHYLDVLAYGAQLRLIEKVTLTQHTIEGDFKVQFSMFWNVCKMRTPKGILII